MHVKAYLERIEYHASADPTAETLRGLQMAHLLTVPFENLSIHAGEPIVLEDGALFDKVVQRRRGGFCYELNGLFAALLRNLGFAVTMLSARVATAEGGFSREFDHMAKAGNLNIASACNPIDMRTTLRCANTIKPPPSRTSHSAGSAREPHRSAG